MLKAKTLLVSDGVCSVYKIDAVACGSKGLHLVSDVSFPVLYSYKDKNPICLMSTSDVLIHTVLFY